MQAEVGQLDVNFREISTTAHVWTIFMTVAMWATKKNHQRHSNCKPGKSIRLPLSALIPSENASSLTSRNLLDCCLQNSETWIIICSSHESFLFVCFFCFPRNASYLIPDPREFPDSPVVRTWSFYHRGLGFNPWSGN